MQPQRHKKLRQPTPCIKPQRKKHRQKDCKYKYSDKAIFLFSKNSLDLARMQRNMR
jgi:hypothetical protein